MKSLTCKFKRRASFAFSVQTNIPEVFPGDSLEERVSWSLMKVGPFNNSQAYYQFCLFSLEQN